MAINERDYGPQALRKSVCSCCKFGVHNGPDLNRMIEEEKRNNLRAYPEGSVDPFMDEEATRRQFGVANYSTIETLRLNSGKTVVYAVNHREGNEAVYTPCGGLRRIMEHRVVVHGYETTVKEQHRFIGMFRYMKTVKKVEIIPTEEKPGIQEELCGKISGMQEISFKY